MKDNKQPLKREYTIQEVARVFSIQPSRLRYWAQTGFIGPSIRKGSRNRYVFKDLITIKTALSLLDAGIPMQQVRKNLQALKTALPGQEPPISTLRITSDGNNVVAVADELIFEPNSGQLVMDFAIGSLSAQVNNVLSLSKIDVSDQKLSAYQLFLKGCTFDDENELGKAEDYYRKALSLAPTLASARTNLGNILHRQGKLKEAQEEYELALETEPSQTEARFNLSNVFDDLNETELAIAEMRRICTENPDFAPAHFNLGLILKRLGGLKQARNHFKKYLELAPDSQWANEAKAHIGKFASP